MSKQEKGALGAIIVVVLFSLGLAFAGSQGGLMVGVVPLFALAVACIFLLQWIAFVPAFIWQTEKFFDLMGSVTFISVSGLMLLLSPIVDGRSLLLFTLILIWAGRLGSFLFLRIRRDGKDGRFDELKTSFFRLFIRMDLARRLGFFYRFGRFDSDDGRAAQRAGPICSRWLFHLAAWYCY